MPSEFATYPGHRFPAEVIHRAAWLYHLFSLRLRDVELLLAERGVVVSHESIRRWCFRFGAEFAARLRKRRPRLGDTWHLHEMYLHMTSADALRAPCSVAGLPGGVKRKAPFVGDHGQ